MRLACGHHYPRLLQQQQQQQTSQTTNDQKKVKKYEGLALVTTPFERMTDGLLFPPRTHLGDDD